MYGLTVITCALPLNYNAAHNTLTNVFVRKRYGNRFTTLPFRGRIPALTANIPDRSLLKTLIRQVRQRQMAGR